MLVLLDPDDEYNKRRGLLGDLTKKTGDLRKKRSGKGGGGKKSDLLGGQAGGGKGRGSRGPVKETNETVGLDDDDMVSMQEQVRTAAIWTLPVLSSSKHAGA